MFAELKENEFFPTPEKLISKMLDEFKVKYLGNDCKVLDPSAGDGRLLKAFVKRFRLGRTECYACEINPIFKFPLGEAKINLLATDFMTLPPVYREQFEYVIMNPPFQVFEAHILRALDFLKPGGILVSVVPTFRLKTAGQPLQQQIQLYGSVTPCGQEFLDAERQTPIEVSILKIIKPAAVATQVHISTKNFNLGEEIKLDDSPIKDAVISTSEVTALVARYNASINALKRCFDELAILRDCVNTHFVPCSDNIVFSHVSRLDFMQNLTALKHAFWTEVLKKTKLADVVDSKFKEKLNDFIQQQQHLEFSEENIAEMLALFMENSENLMNEAMIRVFRELCHYHYRANNGEWGGFDQYWKTNKAHKVGMKVIVPNWISNNYGCISINSYYHEEMNDIDKVMCYLSGKKFSSIDSIYNVLVNARYANKLFSGKLESTFFLLRCYKKGTVHLEFKEANLNKDFNLRVSKMLQNVLGMS